MTEDLIEKLKNSGLRGRGGANFPTGLKWEMVKNAPASKKYIICNATEGEPTVFKDKYILENYAFEVVDGIRLALDLMENSQAYFCLNKDYFIKMESSLRPLVAKYPINLVKKKGGYLCGEETTLIESIESDRLEPRLRPPYPPQVGLWGFPTLVNNVETFYYVSKIAKGEYKNTRFISISGDIKNPGVFELDEKMTICDILDKTDNFPKNNFFIQSGGGASGEFLKTDELSQPMKGTGSLIVYDLKSTDKIKLARKIAKFFLIENCGKCLPCREGVFRLNEALNKKLPDIGQAKIISESLKETSFCGLGSGCGVAVYSLITKFLE